MKNNIVTFVTGVFVGAAAGSAFALLNAPQSGPETRAQIRDGVVQVRTRTGEAIADAQTRTIAKIEEAKNLVSQIGTETKKKTKKLADH